MTDLSGPRRRRLADRVIKEETLVKYNENALRFQEWMRESGYTCNVRVIEELDEALALWVEKMFDMDPSRRNRTKCVYAQCGLQHHRPALRKCLPATARVLKGWDIAAPTEQHAPMPEELMFCVVAQLCTQSKHDMALCVWLTFHCCLRASEAVSIKMEDIFIPPEGDRRQHRSGIRLRKTKTGLNQSVKILDPHLRTALRRYMAGRPRDGRLFGFSQWTLARQVRSVLVGFGLQDKFVPLHSLRHGGATLDYMRGVMPFEDIQTRGRWLHPNTCKRYLQVGSSLMHALRLPSEITIVGDRLASDPERLLSLVSTV